MMGKLSMVKLLSVASIFMAVTLFSGCATGTALVEGVISPSSIKDTLDSVESAALAIRVSNQILLHKRLTEKCQWPEKLQQAPSNNTMLKMGVSGFAMSQGQDIPFEIDNVTGFPRPTSPLYLMLKERQSMINAVRVPKGSVVYKNALYAFGAVRGNQAEVAGLEKEMLMNEKGSIKCTNLVFSKNKISARELKEHYCNVNALKDPKLDYQKKEKAAVDKTELEQAKKKFQPLAKNLYRISLAGADFIAAAIAKLTVALYKAPSAIQNASDEVKKWKVLDVAMTVSRVKNMGQVISYFPKALKDQLMIHKTIISVMKDEYPDMSGEEKEMTAQIIERISNVEIAFDQTQDKFGALTNGRDVQITAQEVEKWEKLAAAFPSEYNKLYPDKFIAENIIAEAFCY